MKPVRVATVLLVALIALLTTPAFGRSATQPRQSGLTPPMMFVVDVSGSMGDPDKNGVVKLEAAQNSLLTAIRSAVTPRQPIGLWSYPAAGEDCGPGKLQRAAVSGGKDELDAIIRALRPNGGTPTAAALAAAVQSLQEAGSDSGTLLLVSDGESNCGPDPCETARGISAKGFQLQVHTVGFDISEQGKRELRCVADATGGRYFDVAEGDALGETLGGLTTPRLSLDIDTPTTTAAGLTVGVSADLANPGVVDANDVVLAIQATVAEDGDVAGFVGVSAPVLRLGNVAAGARASRTWSVAVPPGSTADQLRVRVSASAVATAPTVVERVVAIRGSVGAGDLGPVLAAAEHGTVAIMGDSFASGEGAGGYLSDTDAPANRCHRSPHTYGEELFAGRRAILACSGAVVGNLSVPQWKGDEGLTVPVPAQLGELRKIAGETSLVLISLGGNDIGFAAIVESCVRWPVDCDPFSASLAAALESLRTRLPEAYRSIDAVVNSADAVSHRNGLRAGIVVLAYPSLVSIQDVGTCPYLSRTEADRGDLLVRQLNGVLDSATRTARESGASVYLAEDTVDAFRPDHTLCSDDRYVVPVELTKVLDGPRRQQFMHPDARGYQALTGAVVRWSNRALPPLGDTPSVTDAVRVRDSTAASAASADHVRGELVTTTATGFDPGSQVVLELRSRPRAIATTTADGRGEATFTGELPPDTDVGDHQLVAIGVDPSGATHTTTLPVDIRAALPWWVHGFAVAAGVAVLLAAWLLIRFGRSRRSRADGPT